MHRRKEKKVITGTQKMQVSGKMVYSPPPPPPPPPQAGIKSICAEERGERLSQLQICVQISVVNGVVSPSFHSS